MKYLKKYKLFENNEEIESFFAFAENKIMVSDDGDRLILSILTYMVDTKDEHKHYAIVDSKSGNPLIKMYVSKYEYTNKLKYVPNFDGEYILFDDLIESTILTAAELFQSEPQMVINIYNNFKNGRQLKRDKEFFELLKEIPDIDTYSNLNKYKI